MNWRERQRREAAAPNPSATGSAGGRARAGRQQEPADAPAPPRTPLRLAVLPPGYMVPAPGGSVITRDGGDRDETCARYTVCLDAHLAAYRGRIGGGSETPASCPRAPVAMALPGSGCRWREDAPRMRATEYVSARD